MMTASKRCDGGRVKAEEVPRTLAPLLALPGPTLFRRQPMCPSRETPVLKAALLHLLAPVALWEWLNGLSLHATFLLFGFPNKRASRTPTRQ